MNIWKQKEFDADVLEALEEHDYTVFMSKLLAAKGFSDPQSAEEFLNMSLTKLHDPYLLPNIDIALKRTMKAIKKSELIFIWGDYDVDGVTATTVMIRALRMCGAKIQYHVPHRIKDGYDIKPVSVQKALDAGASLMITVDCGIVAFEAAEYAKEQGIDLIITDHHTPSSDGKLPNCLAVINPKISKSYPFPELAGVGIAFKFACALADELDVPLKKIINACLEFVALGTVADVAPMIDENRIMVYHGCKRLNKSDKVGIRALMKVARTTKVDSTNIGFTLGPRINAVGRLGDSRLALDLLVTDDEEKAMELAQELESANLKRQKIQEEACNKAIKIIEKGHDPVKDGCIVMADSDWHVGVVGLISGKLAEMYQVPALIAHIKSDGFAKGSCRSAQGIDILRCLKQPGCYELFRQKGDGSRILGGHAFAAGFEIDSKNIDALRKALSRTILDSYGIDSSEEHVIYYDAKMSMSDLTVGNINDILKLSPFGSNNEEPVFLVKNCAIENVDTVTSGKHLKLTLSSSVKGFDTKGITCFWWNQGYLADKLSKGDKIDMLARVELSDFKSYYPTFFIVDIAQKPL